MTNHNLPPAEDHEAPMTFEERLKSVLVTSVGILETRPHMEARNQLGAAIITDWIAREGTVKCVLSTPTGIRQNEFFRLEAYLMDRLDDPQAKPSIFAYDKGTTKISASRRIKVDENLQDIDAVEVLLGDCPLSEEQSPQDTSSENPMITGRKHGNKT